MVDFTQTALLVKEGNLNASYIKEISFFSVEDWKWPFKFRKRCIPFSLISILSQYSIILLYDQHKISGKHEFCPCLICKKENDENNNSMTYKYKRHWFSLDEDQSRISRPNRTLGIKDSIDSNLDNRSATISNDYSRYQKLVKL